MPSLVAELVIIMIVGEQIIYSCSETRGAIVQLLGNRAIL
jgi:hypothetical protein